jgi:hypothetical protein
MFEDRQRDPSFEMTIVTKAVHRRAASRLPAFFGGRRSFFGGV